MVSPPKPWERNAAVAASPSPLPQKSAPALPSTPSPATQQAGSSGAASSSQQSQIPTVPERPAELPTYAYQQPTRRNILKDLHHEHIVATYAADIDHDAGIFYVLTEYCGGSDLSTFFKQATKPN
ncbi:hypothetical protein BDQ17DRAFT_1548768 [Cyathus striatus]|nr:hypothetical protein BDQ17DRAFT_1548768 [Cyathus striatus]